MRIWLTRHRVQFLALVIVVTVGATFALGWYAGSHATGQRAYVSLWEAMMDFPDPEQCALCGEGMPYHAPCLLNISTGQMGEMKVYNPHPSLVGEIAPMEMQQNGTFNFQSCAGLMGIRDTSNHICKVTLPEERELINPALYCQDCRQLLAGAGIEGYVIVDLYDLGGIRVYPIRAGMDETIRDYRITVTGDTALDVRVAGLL